MKKQKNQNELQEVMNEVKTRLHCMRSYYNEVTDERLITACIYEINALQAQYSHLINQAKIQGTVADVNLYQVK